jgi:hypothetical protein
MKPLITASAIAVMLTGTALSFSGAGYDRQGNLVNPSEHNVSRYSKTTISPCKGAGQRGNLCMTKYLTRRMRTKSPAQKSQIRQTGRYMNSMKRLIKAKSPQLKPETQVQKNLRLWKAKRRAR